MATKLKLELLLRDMYESMSELSLVLDAEHAALGAQEVEPLMQAAIDKERLSEKIEQLEQQRITLLAEHGLGNDLAAMKQLLELTSGADENALYKLWNMIAELAQECTEKNKLNGIIIETKRRQTTTALSVLHGYHTDNTELYDAEGTTVPAKNNSTIARA